MSLTTIGSANAANDGQDYFKLEAEYDFSVTSQTASSVVQMLTVPAGTFVERVVIKIATVEDGGTIDVGDGSDADGFHDGIDATSAATTVSGLALAEGAPNTIVGYSDGKHYTAEDTIDVTVLGQTFDEAKVLLTAWCKRLS